MIPALPPVPSSDNSQEHHTMSDHPTFENVFKPGHGGGHEGGLASALPLLLAGRADGAGGWGMHGFGAGLVGGLLGGALFGGRRGGLFGGGEGSDCCGAETRLQSNADTLALFTAIGNAKDATTGGFATTALALSQGFAGVKDSIQASTYLLAKEMCDVNQNVSQQGCQTRELVQAGTTAIITALKDNRIAELEDRVRGLHVDGRVRESEINVNQTVNQAQAQQQQQQQFENRFGRIEALLAHVTQIAHATNQNIIAGNSGAVATGPQTANPTNVNT